MARRWVPGRGSLLVSRAALGALTASAMPMLLSLTGDYVPAGERPGRYGRIAAGELVGAGFGFLVSGNLAAPLSWRWAFWVLVAPALLFTAVPLGLAAGLLAAAAMSMPTAPIDAARPDVMPARLHGAPRASARCCARSPSRWRR